MEKAGEIAGGANFGVFKEPRGVIKPIQWILSIFAFATMTGVTLSVSFTANCFSTTTNKTVVTTYNLESTYPYNLKDSDTGTKKLCDNGTERSTAMLGGAVGSAQFYVFVGVMVFLYCIAALVLYIFFDTKYRKYNACTYADFIISGVIVALWLIASSAWAQGVTDLKYYTDLDDSGYFTENPDCKNFNCKQVEFSDFASLNVSIIFGFLNMLVWAGNMWFLYKETPWHHLNQPTPPPASTGGFEQGQQRI